MPVTRGVADLVRILEDQNRRKLDVIAPAAALRFREGNVHVEGVESLITEDGVTEVDGIYRPTAVADEGVADKLRIPLAYLRRMRAENVPAAGRERQRLAAQRPRAAFHAPGVPGREHPGMPPAEGVARALLSDSYKLMDNLDMLLAALDGVRKSGAPDPGDRVRPDRPAYVRAGGVRGGRGPGPCACCAGTGRRSTGAAVTNCR
ncbi:hypothetical protein [Streptomyces sp. R02]|uniref:Uncharacterized protein n=1 Tax=Streptomyces sp. R02 TaxID=3238623 RepID=A0AB39LG32_9ACTN